MTDASGELFSLDHDFEELTVTGAKRRECLTAAAHVVHKLEETQTAPSVFMGNPPIGRD